MAKPKDRAAAVARKLVRVRTVWNNLEPAEQVMVLGLGVIAASVVLLFVWKL